MWNFEGAPDVGGLGRAELSDSEDKVSITCGW